MVHVKGGPSPAVSGKFTRLHLLHIERMARAGVRYCPKLQQSEDLIMLTECRLNSDSKQPCILKSYLYDLVPDRVQCPGGAEDARKAADQRKKQFEERPALVLSSEQMEMVFCGGDDLSELAGMDADSRVRLSAAAGAWPERNPHITDK